MVITEIVNFNKEDSEAEVRVSDGDYSVECYVYPAEMSVFEKQSNVIDGMCCKNIVKANRKRYEIKNYLNITRIISRQRWWIKKKE